MLFNAYLDYVIQSTPVLKDLADKGKLLAFADDILLLSDDREEAEAVIKVFGEIQDFGLKLNLKKT